jgi:hypothetical protein
MTEDKTEIAVDLTARNATLDDLVELLRTQQDVKYDVVAPASALRYEGGMLTVEDGTTELTDYPFGVQTVDASLRPLRKFEDGIADRFKIPRKYIDRMRDEDAVELLDENVNYWMSEDPDRMFLVRGFLASGSGDTETGIARALLSDRYSIIDNLDTLTAALDGIAKSGIDATIGKCNLTERSMYVEVEAPEVRAMAPELLGDYRNPFEGRDGPHGEGRGIIHAGFTIRNSETGGGAFSIVPRIVFETCANGMTLVKEAMRKVHLGAQMDQGEVAWSQETQHHYIELVKGQTIDAVRTFLSGDYLAGTIDKLSEHAVVKLGEPLKVIEQVTSKLGYSDTDREGILGMFVKGGDLRAMGVAQALTAYAQEVDDADKAADLEDDAYPALVAAARIG